MYVYPDSAGKSQLGCGAFFNGQWVFFPWPVHWHGCPIMRDITLLELIPVVLAISTWGSQFSNKKLIMHVDNEAFVSVINKQTSKSKNVMTLVRTLVLCLLQNNTTFRSEHVPGSSNKIADSISRKQWSRFRTLAPGRRISNQNTNTICRDDIQFEIDRLLRASTAESTQETYDRGLTLFATFRSEFQLQSSWPPPLD